MIYTVNKAVRSTIFADDTAEKQLGIILTVMDKHFFGQREAAKIVGGIGRLQRLMEEGKIRYDKPNDSQNGKWFCNAGDVLRYAKDDYQTRVRRARA